MKAAVVLAMVALLLEPVVPTSKADLDKIVLNIKTLAARFHAPPAEPHIGQGDRNGLNPR